MAEKRLEKNNLYVAGGVRLTALFSSWYKVAPPQETGLGRPLAEKFLSK